MAIAIVASPSSLAACVGARHCGGCVVLNRAQGAEAQWRGRGGMRAAALQVTIRTAPEATPPRRGDDDGLRQAPSLVPSCSPSPHCCGTWDDDDAAASDPDRDGPDSAEYYPTSYIQFVHVEYYFNELNEFDQFFARDDQLYLFQHLTKPSSTTGNSATSVDSQSQARRTATKGRQPDHDRDCDDRKETTTKTTATATRQQWRRPRLQRQRGDDSTASHSATTMRKKAYIAGSIKKFQAAPRGRRTAAATVSSLTSYARAHTHTFSAYGFHAGASAGRVAVGLL
ncbi:hypothetical protein EDB84DRAFT_1440615 [Lactarius hengduanensis]|nr:hypothetical protein EDB84DRAFT_1440615 [Lactarius hengduanensis]